MVDMINYIKSPLNYTGGKFQLLDKIIPSFPTGVKNFVDLFAGGMNVSINTNADTIYVNDHIDYLIELYEYFQKTPTQDLMSAINGIIKTYSLAARNADGYYKLRADYNKEKTPLKLYVLSCYSFNCLVRFNNDFEFNMPFGMRRYNPNIENNLAKFSTALKSKNIIFSNQDFKDFDYSRLSSGDLIYCDPPYLITTAAYNDGTRGFGDWTEQEDKALLNILDQLNARGVYFALSNVLYHKGNANQCLIDWSSKYTVTHLDKSYSNCNYQFKDRDTFTDEVLITNYPYTVSDTSPILLW